MEYVKYVLVVGAILIILYLLYNFNKKQNPTLQESQKDTSDAENDKKNSKKLSVYYTDWCGYSKQFLKQLENGLGELIKQQNVELELVNCEQNKETCNAMNVEGFPTLILHTSNGSIQYNGQRDPQSIIDFINN